MDSKTIGRKVGALREKLGMTTTDLAEKADLSQAQVSRLENGKQGFRSATLERISKALGVKPIYFFLEEGAGAVGEGAPVYGLAAGGELVEALRAAEFVRVADKLADAFFHRKDAFLAIRAAVKAIVGEKGEK